MADTLEPFRTRSQYGVVGCPVAHSKSPVIHRTFAEQCSVSMHYDAIELDPGRFEKGIQDLQAAAFGGVNVTLPFKQEAYAMADRLSPRADLAGAVNTLQFSEAGEIYGDNTDGAGLVTDLTVNIGAVLAGASLLIIGAGGAVRGILAPLLAAGVANVTLVNRSHHKAESLARTFAARGSVEARAFEEISSATFDLVINGTAASLEGALPAVPNGVLARASLAYDLSYAERPTPFLSRATQHGTNRALDGLGMLVEQAAESFALWHGTRPKTAPVLALLRGAGQF